MRQFHCYVCLQEKPQDQFFGGSKMCINCKEKLDKPLLNKFGSYIKKILPPPPHCKTCYNCGLTKPRPEFYSHFSICRECRDGLIDRLTIGEGAYQKIIMPAPPYCDICEKPIDLNNAGGSGLSWLCDEHRPHVGRSIKAGIARKKANGGLTYSTNIPNTSCDYCDYSEQCTKRVRVGLWVRCERPSTDDIQRALRYWEDASPKDKLQIKLAIEKVLRHIPKHLIKEEMSNRAGA